jgi:hypothetical protein
VKDVEDRISERRLRMRKRQDEAAGKERLGDVLRRQHFRNAQQDRVPDRRIDPDTEMRKKNLEEMGSLTGSQALGGEVELSQERTARRLAQDFEIQLGIHGLHR